MQQSAVGGQPLFAVEKSDRQLSVPQIRSPAQWLSSSQSPSPKSHVSLVVQQAHWTIGTALHLSFPSTIKFYRSVSTYQCDIINKKCTQNWMIHANVNIVSFLYLIYRLSCLPTQQSAPDSQLLPAEEKSGKQLSVPHTRLPEHWESKSQSPSPLAQDLDQQQSQSVEGTPSHFVGGDGVVAGGSWNKKNYEGYAQNQISCHMDDITLGYNKNRSELLTNATISRPIPTASSRWKIVITIVMPTNKIFLTLLIPVAIPSTNWTRKPSPATIMVSCWHAIAGTRCWCGCCCWGNGRTCSTWVAS